MNRGAIAIYIDINKVCNANSFPILKDEVTFWIKSMIGENTIGRLWTFDPDRQEDEHIDHVLFIFQDSNIALLFKLIWG